MSPSHPVQTLANGHLGASWKISESFFHFREIEDRSYGSRAGPSLPPLVNLKYPWKSCRDFLIHSQRLRDGDITFYAYYSDRKYFVFILILLRVGLLTSALLFLFLYSSAWSFPRRERFPFIYLVESLGLDWSSEFSLCHLLWYQMQGYWSGPTKWPFLHHFRYGRW